MWSWPVCRGTHPGARRHCGRCTSSSGSGSWWWVPATPTNSCEFQVSTRTWPPTGPTPPACVPVPRSSAESLNQPGAYPSRYPAYTPGATGHKTATLDRENASPRGLTLLKSFVTQLHNDRGEGMLTRGEKGAVNHKVEGLV